MTRTHRTWIRHTGSAMAAVYFIVGSVLGYSPETNFWVERRRQVDKRSGSNSSLPFTTEISPRLPVDFLKTLPATTKTTPALSENLAESLPEHLTTRHAKLLEALQTTHGTIRKVWLPKSGFNDRIVIHIQDAHQNEDAQRHIAGTVELLFKTGQAGLIALEGAFDPIDVKAFHDLENRDVVRLTADCLLKENLLTGPVQAAMTTAEKLPPLLGIDDPNHYNANVQAYRLAAPQVDAVKKKTAILRNDLETSKRKHFSNELAAFDTIVRSYNEYHLPLSDYMAALDPKPGVGQGGLLVQALALEKAIDFQRVDGERKELIEALVPKMDAAQIHQLIEDSAGYRLGRIRYGEFYRSLKTLCRSVKVDLAKFPHMDAYIRYVLLSDQIDADKLLDELKVLEGTRYAGLAKTPLEKTLVTQSRFIHLRERLLDFTLTPEEWNEYLQLRKDLGSNDPDLEPFETFYREAIARDTAMGKNLLRAMGRLNSPTAVLVTGGFHSPGISEELRREGITVVSFTPRIEKVRSKENTYLSIFTQEKTPLEKLFSGDRLFVSQHPASPSTLHVTAPAVATGVTAVLTRDIPTAKRVFQKVGDKDVRVSVQYKGAAARVKIARRGTPNSVGVDVVQRPDGVGFTQTDLSPSAAFVLFFIAAALLTGLSAALLNASVSVPILHIALGLPLALALQDPILFTFSWGPRQKAPSYFTLLRASASFKKTTGHSSNPPSGVQPMGDSLHRWIRWGAAVFTISPWVPTGATGHQMGTGPNVLDQPWFLMGIAEIVALIALRAHWLQRKDHFEPPADSDETAVGQSSLGGMAENAKAENDMGGVERPNVSLKRGALRHLFRNDYFQQLLDNLWQGLPAGGDRNIVLGIAADIDPEIERILDDLYALNRNTTSDRWENDLDHLETQFNAYLAPYQLAAKSVVRYGNDQRPRAVIFRIYEAHPQEKMTLRDRNSGREITKTFRFLEPVVFSSPAEPPRLNGDSKDQVDIGLETTWHETMARLRYALDPGLSLAQWQFHLGDPMTPGTLLALDNLRHWFEEKDQKVIREMANEVRKMKALIAEYEEQHPSRHFSIFPPTDLNSFNHLQSLVEEESVPDGALRDLFNSHLSPGYHRLQTQADQHRALLQRVQSALNEIDPMIKKLINDDLQENFFQLWLACRQSAARESRAAEAMAMLLNEWHQVKSHSATLIDGPFTGPMSRVEMDLIAERYALIPNAPLGPDFPELLSRANSNLFLSMEAARSDFNALLRVVNLYAAESLATQGLWAEFLKTEPSKGNPSDQPNNAVLAHSRLLNMAYTSPFLRTTLILQLLQATRATDGERHPGDGDSILNRVVFQGQPPTGPLHPKDLKSALQFLELHDVRTVLREVRTNLKTETKQDYSQIDFSIEPVMGTWLVSKIIGYILFMAAGISAGMTLGLDPLSLFNDGGLRFALLAAVSWPVSVFLTATSSLAAVLESPALHKSIKRWAIAHTGVHRRSKRFQDLFRMGQRIEEVRNVNGYWASIRYHNRLNRLYYYEKWAFVLKPIARWLNMKDPATGGRQARYFDPNSAARPNDLPSDSSFSFGRAGGSGFIAGSQARTKTLHKPSHRLTAIVIGLCAWLIPSVLFNQLAGENSSLLLRDAADLLGPAIFAAMLVLPLSLRLLQSANTSWRCDIEPTLATAPPGFMLLFKNSTPTEEENAIHTHFTRAGQRFHRKIKFVEIAPIRDSEFPVISEQLHRLIPETVGLVSGTFAIDPAANLTTVFRSMNRALKAGGLFHGVIDIGIGESDGSSSSLLKSASWDRLLERADFELLSFRTIDHRHIEVLAKKYYYRGGLHSWQNTYDGSTNWETTHSNEFSNPPSIFKKSNNLERSKENESGQKETSTDWNLVRALFFSVFVLAPGLATAGLAFFEPAPVTFSVREEPRMPPPVVALGPTGGRSKRNLEVFQRPTSLENVQKLAQNDGAVFRSFAEDPALLANALFPAIEAMTDFDHSAQSIQRVQTAPPSIQRMATFGFDRESPEYVREFNKGLALDLAGESPLKDRRALALIRWMLGGASGQPASAWASLDVPWVWDITIENEQDLNELRRFIRVIESANRVTRSQGGQGIFVTITPAGEITALKTRAVLSNANPSLIHIKDLPSGRSVSFSDYKNELRNAMAHFHISNPNAMQLFLMNRPPLSGINASELKSLAADSSDPITGMLARSLLSLFEGLPWFSLETLSQFFKAALFASSSA